MKSKFFSRPGGIHHKHRLTTEQLEDITQQNRIKRFKKNRGYAKQSRRKVNV